jgi:hypothetical protein
MRTVAQSMSYLDARIEPAIGDIRFRGVLGLPESICGNRADWETSETVGH